jgi:S1-C subfamily serine protease
MIVALTAGCIGCGGNGGPDRSADAGAGGRSPGESLALSVAGVEARIGGDEVYGSAAVIDGDRGLVLTSAHAVWGARSVKVTTGLAVLPGRIVARAPCDDLALIETQPRVPGLVTLAGRNAGSARTNAWVTAVGRRLADPEADSLVRIPSRLGSGVGSYPALPSLRAPELDVPLVTDATGGPLLDRAGRLVGLVQVLGRPGGRTVSLAVPWDAVQRRLDQLRPGRSTVYVGWSDSYRCAPRLHAMTRAAHPGFRPRDARLNVPIPATRLAGTEELDRG